METLPAESRNFFAGDRFSNAVGCQIQEVGEDHARCSLPLTENLRNAQGGVMGGALFTLADFTFAVCAHAERRPVVTVSASVIFLHAPKGSHVLADAKMLHTGRSTCAATVTLTDDTGVAVATVSFSGMYKS